MGLWRLGGAGGGRSVTTGGFGYEVFGARACCVPLVGGSAFAKSYLCQVLGLEYSVRTLRTGGLRASIIISSWALDNA